MRSWLEQQLALAPLTEEVETYFLGRGGKEETLRSLGVTTWQTTETPAPAKNFCARYGACGEKLSGLLICPIRSPRGALLGFEGRSIHEKHITDYRLPEEKWQPFFLGLNISTMDSIWRGCDIWITEGLFDKCPLEWLVPETDVVLATVTAALSKRHLRFLQRFCRGWVHMVYDQDATGRKGTLGWVDELGKRNPGALDLLKGVGIKCRDVPYHGGKDPGAIWLQGGLPALKKAFDVA